MLSTLADYHFDDINLVTFSFSTVQISSFHLRDLGLIQIQVRWRTYLHLHFQPKEMHVDGHLTNISLQEEDSPGDDKDFRGER